MALLKLYIAVLFIIVCEGGQLQKSDNIFDKYPTNTPPYSVHYFKQFIDHFDYTNNDIFNQKYLISDTYHQNDVLLFYSGNEGPIESFYENTGFIFELAKELQALVVFGEHRYYGDSLPYGPNKTFEPTVNMRYLSVEQALADYAVLVLEIKTMFHIKKAIVVGGSYGGLLAAWSRFKYPNIFDGALAASAPFYVTAKMILPTAFFGKVTKDFASVDPSCPDIVRQAYTEIDSYSNMGESGLQYLTKSFKLCKTLTQEKVDHLKGWVRNSFTSLAMVDYPYPASFLAPLPAYPVKLACGILVNNSGNILTALADAAGLFYNGTGGTLSCYDIDNEFIDCADPTGCGTGLASLSWDYQACTEMNLVCTTNNVTDMFPPSTYDVTDYCYSRWGIPKDRRNEDWIALNYWAQDMSAGSNIIFSNGDLDPWSVGGILRDLSETLTAIVIAGGAHHLDLRASDPRDPPSVTEARREETAIIKKWISEQ